MKNYDKLIFVGSGNTALSPMAEAILQKKFKIEDILIESRGLVVLFPEPVNPKAEAILVSHGLSMKDYRSQALKEEDFDPRTLMIALNAQVKEKIIQQFEKAQNVYTLCEYIHSDEILQDPYGGTVSDYGRCFDQMQSLIETLGDKLLEEDK